MNETILTEFLLSLPKVQLYTLVFLAVFMIDVFYTLWVRRVNQGKAISAAVYSSLIYICSVTAFSVILSIDTFSIIPALIGGFIATVVTIKWDKKRHNKYN